MTDTTESERSGAHPSSFGDLFDRVTVMHSSAAWSDTFSELSAVLGAPTFSDGNSWSAWKELSLSDEASGLPWALLARASDLDAVAARATELGWRVGQPAKGGHEIRLTLTSPSGLTVIAYTPS
ncbi:hypothetical protein DFR67_103352 [Williamsia limnetica]|uniref:Glyoxalase-like domain-containing protein n=1 Tax=Williamsia limnetica TaxID=882452 RepID=A0A318S5M7_WILLI|nr:hypothetical protein [Williamsia limnetica]PYE19439.1 hypothetical protein DFR67_103352 [Williamsia limnetica]